MKYLSQQKLSLMSEIKKLGYESLRYSIFNDHRPLEWETRIDFDEVSGEYEVYSTVDRASVLGSYKYTDFEEEKMRFIRNLELTVSRFQYFVESNKQGIKVGFSPYYSSPLWDKSDD